MESSEIKVGALTADVFEKDTELESPCEHPETQVTFMQGNLVLHCQDSVLNGGSCKKMIAFRLTQPATVSLALAASKDPEEKYLIGIKCAKCNEGLTEMEMFRDLHVNFNMGLGVVQLTCQSCGTLFGNLPLSRIENIN
jgi:hypothetical protein